MLITIPIDFYLPKQFLEILFHLQNNASRVSAFSVCLPTFEVRANIIHCAFALKEFSAQLLELATFLGDGLLAHFANHFATVREDKTPLEEHDALLQGVDVSFGVQRKMECRKLFLDRAQAVFEISLVLMDEDEIIHISDVVPDTEPFLHEMVEIIQQRKLNELRNLAAKSDALIAAKAVNNFGCLFVGFIIGNMLAQGCFRALMPRFSEIVTNVALQHPAFGAMLLVVSVQMGVHPVERIIHAFATLTSAVIANEAARYLWIEDVVTKAALKLSILNPGCNNFAFLWFVDEKTLIWVDSIFSVKQALPEFVSILQCVGGICRNAILPAHVPAALS